MQQNRQENLNEKWWSHWVGNVNYVISTSQALLDHEFINESFGNDDMYWASPLSPEQITQMLEQSVTLGLYQSTEAGRMSLSAQAPAYITDVVGHGNVKQVGMARLITDHVTTAYVTDVYILPEHRGSGLGKWLIACCNDIISRHSALRRVLLAASPGHGTSFYEKEMGLYDAQEESSHVVIMTRTRLSRRGMRDWP